MDGQTRRPHTPRRIALPRRLSHARADRRGQSLTEFALTLPVTLVLVLFGLDFGRVFLGWVTLTNATREAANFAAINPDAWGATPNFAVQAEYARLVNAETAGANCTMPSTIPDPTFPSGTSLGSPASVTITCRFHLITPVIGDIVGDVVAVTSTSAFPVRAGIIEGIPTPSPSPTPTPSPAPTEEGSSPSPTPTPTPSASPTDSPVPSPTPTCTVPNLYNVQTNSALHDWTTAGFTASQLVFSPLVGPGNNYKIKDQSLIAGSSVFCTSAMTVYDRVQ
jgi:Flp pilus assembly protein TadG